VLIRRRRREEPWSFGAARLVLLLASARREKADARAGTRSEYGV
jgi:hypothetical protein